MICGNTPSCICFTVNWYSSMWLWLKIWPNIKYSNIEKWTHEEMTGYKKN